MQSKYMGFQVIYFPYVSSTQGIAKNILMDRVAIVADEQNAGRGRQGRIWHSPPGGLWITVILKSTLEPQILSLVGGIVIAKALEKKGYKVCLKWPNDVIYKGKKLAGVIGEHYKGYILLGMGINLQNDIPEEIRDIAINIPNLPRDDLLPTLLETLEEEIAKERDEIIEDWKKYNCTLGKKVKIVEDESFVGLAKDLTPEGFLLVEKEGEIKKVVAGDVIILQ
ncbi:biotin-(acetyl-CoA-carboxylase) ligase [Aciduliprofundum boonei T469]|nr:biotin-(acetyl-CoA-carboxylase) ligase [Aciduliprofundum boonei T469]